MNFCHSMKDELNMISINVVQKGPIDLETFKSFSKLHQAILFRTYSVQRKLRAVIIGDEFWEKLSERRVTLSKGRYVNMSTQMLLVSIGMVNAHELVCLYC